MFYTDINNSAEPKFFYYQCLTIQFGLYQYGSAVPSMAQNVLRQILFPTPNHLEQKMIADYLDTKTAKIDQIIQNINIQIKKLQELRKTLVNDVVTGKIKVA
jgi:type I restriction enzyme, S subunit